MHKHQQPYKTVCMNAHVLDANKNEKVDDALSNVCVRRVQTLAKKERERLTLSRCTGFETWSIRSHIHHFDSTHSLF